MATTTTLNKRTELVDTQSVTYIRQMTVNVIAKECKPNTRLYPYFDGVRVDEYVQSIIGFPGDPLTTDSDGNLVAKFNIPGFKFMTGEKIFSLSESEIFIPLDGMLLGSGTGCRALFTTNGVKNFFKTTTDTLNTITLENVIRVEVVDESMPPRYKDPVAQSFDTFGVTGGCFILGVDLYFNTKDASVPVSVELRNMVNGYPTSIPISKKTVSSLPAIYVKTSVDSSVATQFLFPEPVYLKEDDEYCFVVMTNSKQYNIFTSILGEKSLEDGTVVFEQPYLGSVFKSQNNYTWTAAQYEDIKFELLMAEFDITAPATIPMIGTVKTIAIPSRLLSTTTGSNIIVASLPHKHGLEVGSYVQIGVDILGTYNGISGIDMMGTLDGVWAVTTVYNDFAFAFGVGGIATASNNILHGGVLQAIFVDARGSGYDSASPPTVTITGTGTGATATAVVVNSLLTQINVTNGGSGYTTPPTITITDTFGVGGIATSSLAPKFGLVTNRLAHSINPGFPILTPTNTSINTVLNTTVANYPNSNSVTYSAGKDVILDVNSRTDLNQNILVCSTANELYKMSGVRSTTVNIELRSTNKNVSPMFDISDCKSMFYSNNINNQDDDLISSKSSSGSLDSIIVASGGSGYTSTPTVVITSVGGGDFGSGATATAVLVGGVITAINVVNGGLGYLYPPNISLTGGTPTTTAVAVAVITDYNTELSSDRGRSYSRYLTKPNVLSTISKGVRVLVTAYSSEFTTFDVYIRTSLSSESDVHTNKNWSLLLCNTARNKSKIQSEFHEYEFSQYGITPFDVYDLKIVMNSVVPFDVPIIDNYRAIIIT